MLEESIARLNQKSSSDELPPQNPTSFLAPEALPAQGHERPPGQTEQGWEVVMDLNRGPGVIPASCLSEVSDASPAVTRQNLADDFDIVDRGIITLADAEGFFQLYHRRLDHFLYRILSEHDSLASVRKSSPLLTAAICAVGALHTPSDQYQACYRHLVSMASAKMFSKRNSHDDIRAFCIGAFWLSDVSWTLVGAGMQSRAIPPFLWKTLTRSW